jgi:hypothetical protein
MIIHNSKVYLLLEYDEKTKLANADGSTEKAFPEKSKNIY